mmetsp:Transcript_12573/g.19473  ORF Transcript_12573/g.19473 Transcript_12573/m.19473 type:complete len:289 (-) Transcript_12573:1973-2839(-)
MRATEMLFTTSKSIFFPMEPKKDFTNKLQHRFCSSNAQLNIIPKTDIPHIGSGEDKVDGNRFFTAVNFHHEEMIHTEQFDLFPCPGAKGSTLLHCTGADRHTSTLKSKTLFRIATTWSRQTEMSTLRFGWILCHTYPNTIAKTTKHKWTSDGIRGCTRSTIRKYTPLPHWGIFLHSLFHLILGYKCMRHNNILFRLYFDLTGIVNSLDKCLLITECRTILIDVLGRTCYGNHNTIRCILTLMDIGNVATQIRSSLVDFFQRQGRESRRCHVVGLFGRHKGMTVGDRFH